MSAVVADRVVAPRPAEPPARASLHRLQLAAVCLGLALLTFTQYSGYETADTKLDLVVSPWRFLRQAVVMWDPTATAGQLQNQAYGYLFPMGPFFLIGHWMHLSPWVVQRTWESALLVVGFLGVVRLCRLLGLEAFWPRVVAGLVYALAPRSMMELGVISSELLPVAVAPWVLIPLVTGSRTGSPRRAAMRSGVAVLFAGGVNAAATLAILPIPALWLLTRSRGHRRASLLRWWSLAVGLACLWWAIPLVVLGKYSPPFLNWIENAAVTTRQTSLATTLRGAEHWQAYLGPNVWPAGNTYVAVGAVVVATALVAAVGVIGLTGRGVRHRGFLGLTLGVGLVLVTFGHASAVHPLLAGSERNALDGALNAFRNVHKFDPVVRLPVAIGAGWAVAAAIDRLRRMVPPGPRQRRELVQRQAVAVLAIVGLGVVAVAPAVTGELFPQLRAVNEPSWWTDTGKWLGQQPGDGRALVVPGAAAPEFVWGAPRDDPLQPVADGPWTVRDGAPLAQAGYVRLLDEVETRFASGAQDPTLAALLARSGIRYVVVRDDIDPQQSKTVSPLFVAQTLENSPGFALTRSFGADLRGNDPTHLTDLGATDLPGAVSIFTDTQWTGRLALEATAGTVHANGSADELPDLLAAGLRPDQPVEFGPLSSTSGTTVLDDGIRKRNFGFGSIDTYSDTLTANAPPATPRAAPDYLPDPVPPLSTVRYVGIRDITASSSGADVGALINRSPTNDPFSAIDGNAFTAWRPGSYQGGVGQWLRVDLNQPITQPSISAAFAGDGKDFPSRVRVTTSSGSITDVVLPDQLPQTVRLPPGPAAFVTLTILAVADGSNGNSAGIGELSIPGVTASRTLAVPDVVSPDAMAFSVADGERPPCLTVRQAAACNDSWQASSEERNSLDRTVQLAAPETFTAAATVRLQPDSATNTFLDAASPLSAIASSEDSDDPRERAGAAVDGDPTTGWVAAVSDPHPDLRITLPRSARLTGVQLVPISSAPVAQPVEVLIGVGGQLLDRTVPASGVVRFGAAIRAHSLSIETLRGTLRISTDSLTGKKHFLPVGIGEVRPIGRDVPVVHRALSLTLGCGQGPVLDVDGVPVSMSVSAPMSTALQGLPMPAQPCGSGAQPVQLNRGQHRIAMTANLLVRPQTLVMTRLGDHTLSTPVAQPPPPRVAAWGATSRAVTVATAVPSLLVVHENYNAGWRATLDGNRLAATMVDGWQQAWRVPAGSTGVVHLTYTPQRTVAAGLVLGAVAVLVLVVLAFWRRSAARDLLPALHDGVAGTGLRVVTVVVIMVLLGSAVGVAIAGVILLGDRLLSRRPKWAERTTALALVAVSLAELAAPAGSTHPLADNAGVQGLCLVAVGIVLTRALASRGPSPGPREPLQ